MGSTTSKSGSPSRAQLYTRPAQHLVGLRLIKFKKYRTDPLNNSTVSIFKYMYSHIKLHTYSTPCGCTNSRSRLEGRTQSCAFCIVRCALCALCIVLGCRLLVSVFLPHVDGKQAVQKRGYKVGKVRY